MRTSSLKTCRKNLPFIKLASNTKQSGFSLIEVMVSAFVLSVSLLGVLSLQVTSMKGTHQSYMKQQAMGIVHNLIERMHANPSAVIAQDYSENSVSFDCSQALPNCSTASCSPADIAKTDKLNLICGSQVGAGNFTGGIKISNATDNAILTQGTIEISCAPENIATGVLADCASGDVTIVVGWTERAFESEAVLTPDSLEIQTRIGQ